MHISPDAIISPSKLTDYLLKPRPWDDKSKFLAQAGFDADRPEELETAIRLTTALNEATPDGKNIYGTFYRVVGLLTGPSGQSLEVVLIWLQWNNDGSYHFVTLKPAKQRK